MLQKKDKKKIILAYLSMRIGNQPLTKLVLAITNKIDNTLYTTGSQNSLFIKMNYPVIIVQSIYLWFKREIHCIKNFTHLKAVYKQLNLCLPLSPDSIAVL